MSVYKSNSPTRDGRCWFFKTKYATDDSGKSREKVSKKFLTKKEAMEAERKFLMESYKLENLPVDMTFKKLYEEFLKFKSTTVRKNTYYGYRHKVKYIKCFLNMKCVDYNLDVYTDWRNKINKLKVSTRYKNDIQKFWKSIMNYGSNYYGFNFEYVYRKMGRFKNPNEVKKEMNFYTLEEFNQYLKYEDELKYRCLWETLFYCGLRCGEARALTWEAINFNKRTLSVLKQISDPTIADKGKKYIVAPPKTNSSYRTIPMCDVLYDDLQNYKNKLIENNIYTDKGYIFGDNDGFEPFNPENIRQRKLKISNDADLKIIRLHDFRHSCASLLINNGASVTMVAKYLGHTKIEETLNTYSHMFQGALDGVLNIINNLTKNESK